MLFRPSAQRGGSLLPPTPLQLPLFIVTFGVRGGDQPLRSLCSPGLGGAELRAVATATGGALEVLPAAGSRPGVPGPSLCRGFPKADDWLAGSGTPGIRSPGPSLAASWCQPQAGEAGRPPGASAAASTSWGRRTAAPDGADATACRVGWKGVDSASVLSRAERCLLAFKEEDSRPSPASPRSSDLLSLQSVCGQLRPVRR